MAPLETREYKVPETIKEKVMDEKNPTCTFPKNPCKE